MYIPFILAPIKLGTKIELPFQKTISINISSGTIVVLLHVEIELKN